MTWAKEAVRGREGFSLIELLVASVVFASAAVLLSGGLVSANRSASGRIEQIVLTQLLADQLGRLDDSLGEETAQAGACPAPFDDARWTLALHKLDEPLALRSSATLTVMRNNRTLSVVTYRKPAPQP